MLSFILSLLEPIFNYMENPDCVKGDTPTLREQMLAQEQAEKLYKKRCHCCKNCECS